MALTPCAPCDCIPGTIGKSEFYQMYLEVLCQIIAALGG